MIGVFLGVLGVVVGGGLLLRWLIDADPKTLARTLRITGLLLALVLLLGLVVSRNLGPALVVAGFVLPPLLGLRRQARRAKAARGPSPQQSTTIRTAFLNVSLDHDSGEVAGDVVAGRFAGRRFEALSIDEMIRLAGECRIADPQSQAIVEAHLDRSYGFDWREAAAAGEDGGPGAADRPMDEAEALMVLGLGPDASREQIKAAYHRLMKRFHPDQGGSAEMAARLNAARDRLLADR